MMSTQDLEMFSADIFNSTQGAVAVSFANVSNAASAAGYLPMGGPTTDQYYGEGPAPSSAPAPTPSTTPGGEGSLPTPTPAQTNPQSLPSGVQQAGFSDTSDNASALGAIGTAASPAQIVSSMGSAVAASTANVAATEQVVGFAS